MGSQTAVILSTEPTKYEVLLFDEIGDESFALIGVIDFRTENLEEYIQIEGTSSYR